MKSYYIKTVNGKTVFEPREVPVPQPKAGEVLVKVRAASLNRGEILASISLHSAEVPHPAGGDCAGALGFARARRPRSFEGMLAATCGSPTMTMRESIPAMITPTVVTRSTVHLYRMVAPQEVPPGEACIPAIGASQTDVICKLWPSARSGSTDARSRSLRRR